MIQDLSFAEHWQQRRGRGRKRGRDDDIIQASVNDTTVRQAPDIPVKELGNVLPRIFAFMANVPAGEHIHFSKLTHRARACGLRGTCLDHAIKEWNLINEMS
jgi:hypothetical protein